jgi:chromosomal replication initiation ATPase DnaA
MKPLINIAFEAAEAHKTTIADLMGKSRKQNIVRARWAYFQAARDEGYKLAVIGKYVNRGHDTVSYALACMREENRLAQFANT